jgi:hypothetical protein
MFNQIELMEIQDYIIAEEEVNRSDEDDTDYLNCFKTEGVNKYLLLNDDSIKNMIINNIRKKKPLFKITDEEEIKTINEGIKKKNKEYVDKIKKK